MLLMAPLDLLCWRSCVLRHRFPRQQRSGQPSICQNWKRSWKRQKVLINDVDTFQIPSLFQIFVSFFPFTCSLGPIHGLTGWVGRLENDFIGTSHYLLLEFGIKRNRLDSKMFCQFTHRWLLNRLFVLKNNVKSRLHGSCFSWALLNHNATTV